MVHDDEFRFFGGAEVRRNSEKRRRGCQMVFPQTAAPKLPGAPSGRDPNLFQSAPPCVEDPRPI